MSTQPTATTRRSRRLAPAALSLGLLLAGCGGAAEGITLQTPAPEASRPIAPASSAPTSTPITSTAHSPSAASSPSTNPSTTNQQILAQYKAYWSLQQTLQQTTAPKDRRAAVAKVAVDPVAAQTVKVAAERDAAGEVLYGSIVLKPAVDLKQGKKALVRDCQDTSGSGRMKAKTGEKLTVGVPQYVRYTTLLLGSDAVWRVSEVQNTSDGAC